MKYYSNLLGTRKKLRLKPHAADQILAACFPRVDAKKCLECGGKHLCVSPPCYNHKPDCAGMARFSTVLGLLREASGSGNLMNRLSNSGILELAQANGGA